MQKLRVEKRRKWTETSDLAADRGRKVMITVTTIMQRQHAITPCHEIHGVYRAGSVIQTEHARNLWHYQS